LLLENSTACRKSVPTPVGRGARRPHGRRGSRSTDAVHGNDGRSTDLTSIVRLIRRRRLSRGLASSLQVILPPPTLVSRAVAIADIIGEFDPGSGRTLAACLTHASRTNLRVSGERVSNTWATCPELWDNSGKPELIPDMTSRGISRSGKFFGSGWARGLSACWWGDGLPRRRRVTGLRGRPVTLGLRHGPDSYGRQQWGILRNGRKPDAATPREG